MIGQREEENVNLEFLSREFNATEKAGLILLTLILLALSYYQFVDKPVRRDLAEAAAQKEKLTTDLTKVNADILRFQKMEAELADEKIRASRMPSYNANKEEIARLNSIFESTLQYSVSFSAVSRNGDQIRRPFSLRYAVDDFPAAKAVVYSLARGDLRCLINNVSFSSSNESVSVNLTGTFFETMVGGTADVGLPSG